MWIDAGIMAHSHLVASSYRNSNSMLLTFNNWTTKAAYNYAYVANE